MPTINVQLAEYSELFMLIAAFIYTLAFILFSIDAARSSATIRRVEAELAQETEAERAALREKKLVAAGSADSTAGEPAESDAASADTASTSGVASDSNRGQ